jgi:hypothetical protein
MFRFIKTIIKIKLMIFGLIAILWFAKRCINTTVPAKSIRERL